MNSTSHQAADVDWGIRQFAAMFDVTARTLRFYEDKGLLSPHRDDAGTRIYGREERARFERIMRAKRMGFSLDDIKIVLDVTAGHVSERDELQDRKALFQSALRGLKRRREDIDIMSRDLAEIIDVIDEHLENIEEEPSVKSLAAKYEAAFKKSFAHADDGQGYSFDYQTDDFAAPKHTKT